MQLVLKNHLKFINAKIKGPFFKRKKYLWRSYLLRRGTVRFRDATIVCMRVGKARLPSTL